MIQSIRLPPCILRVVDLQNVHNLTNYASCQDFVETVQGVCNFDNVAALE